MEENNKSKWLIPVGIGCVVILCLCLVGVGGFYFLGDRLVGELGGLVDIPGMPEEIDNFLDTGEVPEPPIDTPPQNPPTPEPAVDQPPPDTGSLPAPHSTSTSFFDDFSSDAFDWPVYDDGITILKYENQAYSLELTEPNTLDGAWLPTTFNPTDVKFDIWGTPGESNGSVGIDCQVQDDNFQNHYYVELDLYYNEFVIGGVYDGEYVDFVDTADSSGWAPIYNMSPNPEDPDTIEISCGLNTISLTVNGQLEHEVYVDEPFTTQGATSLFLYSYENITGGFKVFFDNFSATP